MEVGGLPFFSVTFLERKAVVWGKITAEKHSIWGTKILFVR
jgi:hypothetical protein